MGIWNLKSRQRAFVESSPSAGLIANIPHVQLQVLVCKQYRLNTLTVAQQCGKSTHQNQQQIQIRKAQAHRENEPQRHCHCGDDRKLRGCPVEALHHASARFHNTTTPGQLAICTACVWCVPPAQTAKSRGGCPALGWHHPNPI